MLRNLLLACSCLLLTTGLFAQRNCGSMDHLEQLIQAHPEVEDRMNDLERFTNQFIIENEGKALVGNVLTIPVIVHVVYNGNQENISDNQIQSQIDVLNEDFRRLNADASDTPADFVGVAADSEIEFCLTQTIRVPTSVNSFGTNDAVKSASSGGSNVITPDQALNIWVCDIGGGILGYAQFPGGPASTDGVVCDYRYFGTNGTATAPFNLGRTATHEVGHWLNLRHIWGDGGCRVDDQVSDTPPAGGPNYTGSPCSYPGPNSCRPRGNQGGTDFPDMFQNYMDYSDDVCMNLFTEGQKNRMWAAINGARPGLLAAPCDGNPPPPPPTPEICDNNIDDDGDGQIDCADGDCSGDAACQGGGGCDAPTGLSHTRRRGGREAILSWNAVASANSYEVEVFNSSGTLIASGTITGTSATVTGLTKNAAYTWRVRANCGNSTSDWADGAFNARLANLSGLTTELSVFPNPTNQNEVTLQWDIGESTAEISLSEATSSPGTNGPVTIQVRDLTSRQLIEQRQMAGDSQTLLDISTLNRGVYIIQITGEDGYSISTKLIKL